MLPSYRVAPFLPFLPTCDDTWQVDAHRNVSVFLQHSFELTGATTECALQIQVKEESSSGGHKFKVRTVTLSTT